MTLRRPLARSAAAAAARTDLSSCRRIQVHAARFARSIERARRHFGRAARGGGMVLLSQSVGLIPKSIKLLTQQRRLAAGCERAARRARREPRRRRVEAAAPRPARPRRRVGHAQRRRVFISSSRSLFSLLFLLSSGGDNSFSRDVHPAAPLAPPRHRRHRRSLARHAAARPPPRPAHGAPRAHPLSLRQPPRQRSRRGRLAALSLARGAGHPLVGARARLRAAGAARGRELRRAVAVLRCLAARVQPAGEGGGRPVSQPFIDGEGALFVRAAVRQALQGCSATARA